MPDTAKILQFPGRPTSPAIRAIDALRAANCYLASSLDERARAGREALLETPDVLLSTCALLRERVDIAAAEVLSESSRLYQSIASSGRKLGIFDERDYFLGETALLAGT